MYMGQMGSTHELEKQKLQWLETYNWLNKIG